MARRAQIPQPPPAVAPANAEALTLDGKVEVSQNDMNSLRNVQVALIPEAAVLIKNTMSETISKDVMDDKLRLIKENGTAIGHRWERFGKEVYLDKNSIQSGDELGVWFLINKFSKDIQEKIKPMQSAKELHIVDCRRLTMTKYAVIGYREHMAKGEIIMPLTFTPDATATALPPDSEIVGRCKKM